MLPLPQSTSLCLNSQSANCYQPSHQYSTGVNDVNGPSAIYGKSNQVLAFIQLLSGSHVHSLAYHSHALKYYQLTVNNLVTRGVKNGSHIENKGYFVKMLGQKRPYGPEISVDLVPSSVDDECMLCGVNVRTKRHNKLL